MNILEELYRAKTSITDNYVYSNSVAITSLNYSVTPERVVAIHLPEKEYNRLCDTVNQHHVEKEICHRYGEVYKAWHQYKMLVQLYS